MAKIRNSSIPNTYGDGHEKIITMDNGEEYILRNKSIPNTYGDGYEQEIVKRSEAYDTEFCLGEFLIVLFALLYLIAMFILFPKYGFPVFFIGLAIPIIVPIILTLCGKGGK